jgi:hypothetical protein
MSLHEGIDTVALATVGTFSMTYGNAEGNNRANLYSTWGLIEDAVDRTLLAVAAAVKGLRRLGLSLRLN